MEEDLIIGDPTEDCGQDIDGGFEFDDVPQPVYVDMAMNVIMTLDGIDTALLSKASAERIKQMKRWAIYIGWSNLKDIYELLTDQDDD